MFLEMSYGMFVIDQPRPLVTWGNAQLIKKILRWRQNDVQDVGRIFKVAGFAQHNWLVDINSVFSTQPAGMLIDRTQTVATPVNFHVPRAWQTPAHKWTLEQALAERVTDLIRTGHKINLLWSGGIDSTTVMAAMLQHTSHRDQLRVLYSPFSVYEHPGYLDFLKKFDDLELVDISGQAYMTHEFDGIFVTGDGGDEYMASLDQSFFDQHGRDALDQPWLPYLTQVNDNDEFLQFCHTYLSKSGRNIDTLLEARWFFYAMCKTRVQLLGKLGLFAHYKTLDNNRLVGFFDCAEFENYIYWNLDQIIPGPNYKDWKLPFKRYCVRFDGFEHYYLHKQKQGSFQTQWYANKNQIMHDQRSIMTLSNGQRIATTSLPLFSHAEFAAAYQHRLDYLFNDPV